MKKLIISVAIMTLFGNLRAQNTFPVVPDIDLKRYAGTWYEIARKPFVFESKLKCITATYTLRDDGKINVLNRGRYISNPSKISTAEAVAWAPDKSQPAKLKVRFFWPFSGDYWVMELDKDYRYAMVGDPSLKYLWILSRDKKLDGAVFEMLKSKAVKYGYDVSDLIIPLHDCD
ncbi:MAG: lipocalin family protein [Bacteroidales bacterium]|nr:lipocalin family protein [Bacteroidales bacterium]